MFENILVCLDGTKFSEAIIPIVAELAMLFRSKIILLNVIIVPSLLVSVGKTELEPKQSTEISEGEEEAARYLDSTARTLMERGLDVDCVIVEGTVEESIIACARTYKASLIALASHNRCRLIRFVLGSITDFIQKKTGIPVLSINPQSEY
jgi:nucleotide-binding universal stress UspA family protein